MTDLFPRGLPQGNKSVGGSKGVCPLGRRARVHATPEKGSSKIENDFGDGYSRLIPVL
jgi:hypothetical protein